MTTATVIGTGYVGLVTAACLAEMGHAIHGVDRRPELVDALDQGEVPIHEPGLEPLLRRGLSSRRLRFTLAYEEALQASDIAFICVDTPMTETGAADVGSLDTAALSIARAAAADRDLVVVIKSTAPVGTARRLAAFFDTESSGRLSVVSNPEFLQQGNAVNDFMHPRRIIIGTREGHLSPELTLLYAPFAAPIVHTNWETAEISKYASNAFLAARISFINEIALICDAAGADVTRVAEAMGMDPRIGPDFLNAGLGFGGSCLPKDVAALAYTARVHGVEPQLLAAVDAVNRRQRTYAVRRLEEALGRLDGMRLALLGLSFKPGTDDTRDSPALAVLDELAAAGARVVAFDPVAGPATLPAGTVLAGDPYEAVAGADAVLLLTDWPLFRDLSWSRVASLMRGRVVLDARNMLRNKELAGTGLRRVGIGVPPQDSE